MTKSKVPTNSSEPALLRGSSTAAKMTPITNLRVLDPVREVLLTSLSCNLWFLVVRGWSLRVSGPCGESNHGRADLGGERKRGRPPTSTSTLPKRQRKHGRKGAREGEGGQTHPRNMPQKPYHHARA